MQHFSFSFSSQRGAIFGMDARIALIIASVLAAVGGITIMQRIERSKVEAAERGVEVLRDALESHYKTIGLSTLAADINTLFTSGQMQETTLTTDPWGNAWHYAKVSDNTVRIEDVPVTVHMATIHSSGRDGVNDSATIATIADWTAWAPAGDDIGVKFKTIEIEKQRVNEYRSRGKLIVNKVEGYADTQYQTVDAICTANSADAVCTHGASSTTYTQYSFYPKSDLDVTAGVVYYMPDVTGSGSSYISGDLTNMQSLMTLLGLPTSFAKDPWGRILHYNSNVNGATEAPFTASVWYQ